MSAAPCGEVVDRFGRPVPATPVVRLRVDRMPGRTPLVVDGVVVPVGRGADPHRAGLAHAARRARMLGRPVRVEMASPWSAWPLVVHPDGAVDDLRPAPRSPRRRVPASARPLAGGARRPRGRGAAALGGVTARPRRPVGLVAAAGALAAALLVGGVGTGVATVAAPSAAPAPCRAVTLFAVNGDGAAGGETLAAVTDPLVQRVGDRLAVVAVPAPEVGAGTDEQQAVTSLADSVAAQLATCPDGDAMLFGYSQGAQVAGDVAARVGSGQEPRIPADRILAVGLFGDPARDPSARVVPEGVTGQGVLPPRQDGFGALAGRTIEVCAPDDPVCATTPGTTPPPLEQAVAAPAHTGYTRLDVAANTPATRWASDSLGRLVSSLPTDGAAPGPSTTTAPATSASGTPTPGTPAPGTTAPRATAPYTTPPGATAPGTTAPGTTAPGTTAPGAMAPYMTAPGTTAPGSTAPYTTAPGSTAPYTTAPGTTAPGTTAPGTTAPGTTAPGTTAPGTTTSGTTTPGSTAPYTTTPGTTTSGTRAPGSTAPYTTAPGATAPYTTPPGTTAPGTTAPYTTAPGAMAPYTTPPGTTAPGTTAPGTTAPGTGGGYAGEGTIAATTTTPPRAGRDGSAITPTMAPGAGDGTGSGGDYGGGVSAQPRATTAPDDVPGSSSDGGASTSGTTTRTTTRTTGGTTTTTASAPSGSSASTDDTTTDGGAGGTTTAGGRGGTRGTGGTSDGGDTGALWALTSGLEGFQDSDAGNVEGGGLAPQVVPSPNVPGRTVVKLEVPAGGKRSEVRPQEAQSIRAGQHLFFGYSAFLPQDFPVNASRWQVVWQLHDGGTNTSPPMALEIVDGKLWLSNVGDRVQDLGPVQAGRNLAVQLDVTFAVGGGSVSVYREGQQVLRDFRPPRGTMIDSSDFLKTGIYRDPGQGGGGATLFLNDLKIGDTLASVSNLAGAEGSAGAGDAGAATDTASDTAGATAGGTDSSATGAATGTTAGPG